MAEVYNEIFPKNNGLKNTIYLLCESTLNHTKITNVKNITTRPFVANIYARIKHKFPSLMWMLMLLLPLLPQYTNALPTRMTQSPPCWYTIGSTHFIKIEIESTFFRSVTNSIYPNTVEFEIRLYGGCPSVTPIYTTPPTASGSSVLLYNVGSFTPPYYFEIVEKHYTPAHVLIGTYPWAFPTALNPGDCPKALIPPYQNCPPPLTVPYDGIEKACFYKKNIDDHLRYYLDVQLSSAALFYLAYHGYSVRARVANYTTTHIYTTPYSIIGNSYTYDVTSLFPIASPGCLYFVEMTVVDALGNPITSSPPDWYTLSPICECDAPCDADFSLSMTSYDATDATLQFTETYVGSTLFDQFTVTSTSGGPTYTYSPYSLPPHLPYGTYVVCHKLVTNARDTCEICRTICLLPDPLPGGGQDPADICMMASYFITDPLPFDATQMSITCYASPLTPLGMGWTETYFIYQGATLVYSGPSVSILLPYNTYVVCREVTSPGGQTCRYCVTICLSGDSNPGGGGGGNQERMTKANLTLYNGLSIYPNPALNSINIDLSMEKGIVSGMEIYDATGRVVYTMDTKNADGTKAKYSISTESFAPGIYILKVKTGNGYLTKSFAIQR